MKRDDEPAVHNYKEVSDDAIDTAAKIVNGEKEGE